MNTNTISISAVVLGLSVTFIILALHVWSFRRIPHPKRRQYLLILSILILCALFIPIADGSGHVATIRLLVAYYFLIMPDFYLAGGRDLWIDCAVFLQPVVHNLLCVFLASIAANRFLKAEQDVPPNA